MSAAKQAGAVDLQQRGTDLLHILYEVAGGAQSEQRNNCIGHDVFPNSLETN